MESPIFYFLFSADSRLLHTARTWESLQRQSYQPLCTRRCGTDSVDSRSDPEILVSFNDNSVLCTRRCHSVCFRIHRHDRYEACYDGKYELPQYLHRRSCSRSGNGRFTGLCLFSFLPGLGNYHFRQIAGSYRYSGCCFLKRNASKGQGG